MDTNQALALAGLLATIVGVGLAYVPVSRQVNRGIGRLALLLRRSGKRAGDAVRRRLGSRPTYIVGCFPYEPLMRHNPHDRPAGTPEYEGPWFELMQDVAERLDINIQMQPIFAREFARTRDIAADFVPGLFQTAERELHFDFSAPFHRIGLQGICRRNRPMISKEELVSGQLRVVVQPGEVGWEYADDQLRSLRDLDMITDFPSEMTFEIIHQLLSDRYDVAICDEVSCLHFLQEYDRRKQYRLAFNWRLPSYPVCIAVKKELSWDIAALSEAVKQARNTPRFLELERRWIVGEFDRAIEKCYLGTPLKP